MPTAKPLLYRSNMPLSFAAILPHSPLLVPNIGKDNLSFFKQTLAGAEILAQHLEKAEVDMMLVISSHGTILQENFVCNIAPHFEADLSAFGDLVTRWEHTGSLSTPARMQQQVTRPLSIKLTSESLDYASAIALYLAKVPERIPVAALTVPPQPSETANLYKNILLTKKKELALLPQLISPIDSIKNRPPVTQLRQKSLNRKFWIISSEANIKIFSISRLRLLRMPLLRIWASL